MRGMNPHESIVLDTKEELNCLRVFGKFKQHSYEAVDFMSVIAKFVVYLELFTEISSGFRR